MESQTYVKEEDRQYVFKEIVVSPNFWITQPYIEQPTEQEKEQIDYIYMLKHKLCQRIYLLVEGTLSVHQKKVLTLWMQGKTYEQMAELLDINYTAIAHAIMGIRNKKLPCKKAAYSPVHGGLFKRLKRLVAHDSECMELWKEIKTKWEEISFS